MSGEQHGAMQWSVLTEVGNTTQFGCRGGQLGKEGWGGLCASYAQDRVGRPEIRSLRSLRKGWQVREGPSEKAGLEGRT